MTGQAAAGELCLIEAVREKALCGLLPATLGAAVSHSEHKVG